VGEQICRRVHDSPALPLDTALTARLIFDMDGLVNHAV
jgi:hypothetical protein